MRWRQRPPAFVSFQTDMLGVLLAVSAACKYPAKRHSLLVDPSFLFFDKRRELCGEECLYSEKN